MHRRARNGYAVTHGAFQHDPLFEPERSQVERAGVAFAGLLRRRLVLWAIRWTVGFIGIGIAVYLRPTLAWLFWAGAGLAGVSLVLMLTVHRVTVRRLATAERRIQESEQIARGAERDGKREFD